MNTLINSDRINIFVTLFRTETRVEVAIKNFVD